LSSIFFFLFSVFEKKKKGGGEGQERGSFLLVFSFSASREPNERALFFLDSLFCFSLSLSLFLCFAFVFISFHFVFTKV